MKAFPRAAQVVDDSLHLHWTVYRLERLILLSVLATTTLFLSVVLRNKVHYTQSEPIRLQKCIRIFENIKILPVVLYKLVSLLAKFAKFVLLTGLSSTAHLCAFYPLFLDELIECWAKPLTVLAPNRRDDLVR